MAIQTFNNVYACIKKNSAWGTEADVSTGALALYASAISVGGGFADFLPRDFGQGGKRTNNARLQADFNVTITTDMTYGQSWIALLASVAGTESVPAEQTVGEGDYLVTHDIADSTAISWTLCWTIETDRVLAIPSVQITGFTISQAINGAGTVTFRGIADRIIESSANTAAEVAAATSYNYETCTLGGTNHYFRIDAYSTGTALSSLDEKTITSYTVTLDRPFVQRRGLRGANTAYTLAPLQTGPIEASLQVVHSELDNATFDMITYWTTPSFLMAELFVDGSAIGAGVNRSIKLQFPTLKVKGAFPAGHDVASNNGLFAPSITFDMLKAASAPASMSGVTELLRMTEIHPVRSSKWTS